MISRRTFGKFALGSLPLAASWAKIDSTIHGVRIGVSGYSFQHFSLDMAIGTMKSIGLGPTEVWFRPIEPKLTREELRAWRLSVPLDEFRQIAKKYDDAGIDKIAFTHDMKDDFTSEEIERPFHMAKALGCALIATSTTLTVARRLAPLMEKYGMEVAFHGHTNTADPNEFPGRSLSGRRLRCGRLPESIWISPNSLARDSIRSRSSPNSMPRFRFFTSATANEAKLAKYLGAWAMFPSKTFFNC